MAIWQAFPDKTSNCLPHWCVRTGANSPVPVLITCRHLGNIRRTNAGALAHKKNSISILKQRAPDPLPLNEAQIQQRLQVGLVLEPGGELRGKLFETGEIIDRGAYMLNVPLLVKVCGVDEGDDERALEDAAE